jgi:uncharacterized protein (DUF433 family)
MIKTRDKTREMTVLHPRIERNPDVMVGKPVIRGTRITVEIILRRLADDYTIEQVLDDYPHITREDVLSALGFAADHMAAVPQGEAA